VLTYCAQLERPQLIIHGTSDDNVYFQHSLKMTEALFKSGRQFEFLPLAGFTHMVPDPVVTARLQQRMMDFFARTIQPRPE
jgi:dipeptidyl-peptidase-4